VVHSDCLQSSCRHSKLFGSHVKGFIEGSVLDSSEGDERQRDAVLYEQDESSEDESEPESMEMSSLGHGARRSAGGSLVGAALGFAGALIVCRAVSRGGQTRNNGEIAYGRSKSRLDYDTSRQSRSPRYNGQVHSEDLDGRTFERTSRGWPSDPRYSFTPQDGGTASGEMDMRSSYAPQYVDPRELLEGRWGFVRRRSSGSGAYGVRRGLDRPYRG
jgi:hypothetical protein